MNDEDLGIVNSRSMKTNCAWTDAFVCGRTGVRGRLVGHKEQTQSELLTHVHPELEAVAGMTLVLFIFTKSLQRLLLESRCVPCAPPHGGAAPCSASTPGGESPGPRLAEETSVLCIIEMLRPSIL